MVKLSSWLEQFLLYVSWFTFIQLILFKFVFRCAFLDAARDVSFSGAQPLSKLDLPQLADRGKTSLIFDGMMLNHEAQTFKTHVMEHKSFVDHWIVVESEISFRCTKKRNFPVKEIINALVKDYKELSGRIHYVFHDEDYMLERCKARCTNWCNEETARYHIGEEFFRLGGTHKDVLMISDVDEIMNADCWHLAEHHLSQREKVGLVGFTTTREHHYRQSFRCHAGWHWQRGPLMAYGDIVQRYGSQNYRGWGACMTPHQKKCVDIPNKLYVGDQTNCSWHLSGFGGREVAKRKFDENPDGADSKLRNVTAALYDCRDHDRGENGYFEKIKNFRELRFPDIPKYVMMNPHEFPEFWDP